MLPILVIAVGFIFFTPLAVHSRIVDFSDVKPMNNTANLTAHFETTTPNSSIVPVELMSSNSTTHLFSNKTDEKITVGSQHFSKKNLGSFLTITFEEMSRILIFWYHSIAVEQLYRKV